jgi:hypothetical protein
MMSTRFPPPRARTVKISYDIQDMDEYVFFVILGYWTNVARGEHRTLHAATQRTCTTSEPKRSASPDREYRST